jgi:hypothetical protein
MKRRRPPTAPASFATSDNLDDIMPGRHSYSWTDEGEAKSLPSARETEVRPASAEPDEFVPQSAPRRAVANLVRCTCDRCGYNVTIAAGFIEKAGAPICPEHGAATMVPETLTADEFLNAPPRREVGGMLRLSIYIDDLEDYRQRQAEALASSRLYSYNADMNIAAAIRLAAEIFGLTEAELTEAAHQYKAAKAEATARETTGRATDDTRLGRLQTRFERRLREIELPEGGFSSKAQAKAADRLWKTYRDLQKVEAELGLPVTEKPDRVTEAVRMRSLYRLHHTKTGEIIPPRPRGRPRRRAPEQASASSP